MFKYIVAFAWVSGLLGLAGIITILLNLTTGLKATNAKPSGSIQNSSTKALKPGAKGNEDNSSKHNNKFGSSAAGDLKISVNESENDGEIAGDDELLNTVYLVEGERAAPEKYLSAPGLEYLLSVIKKTAIKYHVRGRCIQLNCTSLSRNSALFNQVEKFLLSHEFMLMEKEVQNTESTGIKILPKDNCICITIGNF